MFDNHDERVEHLTTGASLRVSPVEPTHEQLVHLAEVAAQYRARLTVIEANALTHSQLAEIAAAAKSAVAFEFA